jgi:segregation and condensation protein B
MDQTGRKRIVEALILSAEQPVSAARLAELTPGLKPAKVKEVVAELGREYAEQQRGFEIWEVAGGYQLRTCPDLAPYVRQLHKERALRLSRAAIETLSVIAYKQPVTRAEVENIRGVDVGAVLRSVVERGLVRIAGHREVPGRPMLYGTTRRFLEVFGLERLDDLPTLRQIDELLPEGARAEDDSDATDDERPSGAPLGGSEATGDRLTEFDVHEPDAPETPPELH